MSDVVNVEVQLPDWLWWELASMADARHVKVGDVVADAVWAKVLPLSPKARDERINELRALGYSASEISSRVGMRREAVANVLRRAS